jgi:hypothetical protein
VATDASFFVGPYTDCTLTVAWNSDIHMHVGEGAATVFRPVAGVFEGYVTIGLQVVDALSVSHRAVGG